MRKRKLFWSKLLTLHAVVVVVVGVAWSSYLERAEIAEVWKSLRDSIERYFDQKITP